jgi:phage terminase large subunit GpA-like protein
MLPAGRYIHQYPGRKIRGFKYNALCTPLGWVNSWAKIAESFLKAKNNPEKLQVWTNTLMAETFEMKGSRPEWEKLAARAEPYKIMAVPAGGMLLTGFCDVHDNRLDVVVRAWGRGEESWLIYWTRIYGDVTQDEPWQQIDNILSMEFRHDSGVGLRISSFGVDSGDNTQTVYNYCRKRRGPVVFASGGSSKRSQPIIGKPTKKDVDYRGAMIKNGVMLWPIGTDTAKATIYQRLNISDPRPGCYHFPIGIDDEYYHQLSAEKLVTVYDTKGFAKHEWHVMRGNGANHALDCEVGCYAAAVRVGLATKNWDAIERNLYGSRIKKLESPSPVSVDSQVRPVNEKKNSTFIPRKSGWLR